MKVSKEAGSIHWALLAIALWALAGTAIADTVAGGMEYEVLAGVPVVAGSNGGVDLTWLAQNGLGFRGRVYQPCYWPIWWCGGK